MSLSKRKRISIDETGTTAEMKPQDHTSDSELSERKGIDSVPNEKHESVDLELSERKEIKALYSVPNKKHKSVDSELLKRKERKGIDSVPNKKHESADLELSERKALYSVPNKKHESVDSERKERKALYSVHNKKHESVDSELSERKGIEAFPEHESVDDDKVIQARKIQQCDHFHKESINYSTKLEGGSSLPHYSSIQKAMVLETLLYDLPRKEEIPSHKSPQEEEMIQENPMYSCLPRQEYNCIKEEEQENPVCSLPREEYNPINEEEQENPVYSLPREEYNPIKKLCNKDPSEKVSSSYSRKGE